MTLQEDDALARSLLDAIPAYVFAVDEDVRVLEYNEAAAELVGQDRSAVLMKRGGDVMHCLHSTDAEDGCGRGPECKLCTIRNSVREALQGDNVVRRRLRLELLRDEDRKEIHALLSVSPLDHKGERLALLVIEDIGEVAELQRLLPICARCKRIRNDNEYWERVELYLSKHYDLAFSHGLCPECLGGEVRKADESAARRRPFRGT